MTKQELTHKLNDIEWEDFEVKSAQNDLPKSAWESVSSFSNSSGGWLIFGIEEVKGRFEIIGVSNPAKLEHEFLNTLNGEKFNVKIRVKSEKYNFNDKTVLAFYIPISKQKPIYFNNQSNTKLITS